MGDDGAIPNAKQRRYWDEVAPSWAESQARIGQISGPFGDAALDALRLRVGERVLDIGCGSGDTTRALADALHPSGAAVGVDLSPVMIEIARASVFHGGATFQVADLESERPEGAPFDAAYSRFGVMFFEDPVAAFTNIRGLLHPGGRLAFCCWQEVAHNDWMAVAAAAVAEATGEPPRRGDPGAPGPFALADPARIEEVLGAAGFSLVRIEPVEGDLEWPEAEIEEVVAILSGVGPVRDAVSGTGADATVRDRVLGTLRQRLAGFLVDAESEEVSDGDAPDGDGSREADEQDAPDRSTARVISLHAAAHLVTARA